ncbi:MAG: transcription antitermination factor NusB, partial [Acidimicrobiales bacterium]
MTAGVAGAGAASRRLAIEALLRIDTEGAYANLVVPAMLSRSELSVRDRALVTELVYGTTRRRRALDHVLDAHLVRDPPAVARAALRVGAHQLLDMGMPAHAAVSTVVEAAPRRFRGLVNAVLRRVATGAGTATWPDDATRLSYPDWIVERLEADLGLEDAHRALAAMNQAATTHRRDDGYVQDPSSALVVDAAAVEPGRLVLDVCAAPGGKATALAAKGATVVAADMRESRAGLLLENRERLGLADLHVVVADGLAPPFARASFDCVLVDAPCSGLGALRRRPDARWRIGAADVDRLAVLQRRLVEAAIPL